MRKIRILLAVLAAAFLFGFIATKATGAVAVPKPYLTISVGKSALSSVGGGVTVRADERGLMGCAWSSVPKIKDFDGAVKCKTAMSRVAHVPASTTSHAYTFTMTALNGKHKMTARTSVIQSAAVVTVVASSTVTTIPTLTTTTTTPTIVTTDLAVHLDPTFVQSASNPLSVVYMASATASQQVNQSPSQPVASLPQGVLDFYNDGNLACSTNVGGNTTTTNCPVVYTALGAHTVVTEYISGINSATETDVEQINGQTSTTTVQLTGDPGTGATTSTLVATVSSSLGTDSTPATGAVTFLVDNAVLHTTQANQTSCTLSWSPGPTFTQGNSAYLASATSPDCSVTGTVLTNVSSLTYSASFAGVLGLTASASASQTTTDWPQVPQPITNYVTGDPYDIAIGATTVGNCKSSLGYGSIQFCLNAPTLTLTDAGTGQSEGTVSDYFWMTTSLADSNSNPYTPGTGENCGTFEGSDDQCPLGNNNQYGHVPNPLVVTFVLTPPNGYIVTDLPVVIWQGAQETTTVTTHALVGSASNQTLGT